MSVSHVFSVRPSRPRQYSTTVDAADPFSLLGEKLCHYAVLEAYTLQLEELCRIRALSRYFLANFKAYVSLMSVY